MRIAIQFIAALLFAVPVVQAQAPKTYNTNSVVLADTKTRIGQLLMIEPDCELIELTIRITKAPVNGKLEVVEGEAFPYYAKDNPRAKCNDKKVFGASLIFYAPKAGFKGADTASVEVITSRGQSYRYVWNITIK